MVGFVAGGLTLRRARTAGVRCSVRKVTCGVSEDWSVVDRDPSAMEGMMVGGTKKAQMFHQAMPEEVKARGGSGAWSSTDMDVSRMASVYVQDAFLDFDPSHVEGSLAVGSAIAPPRQAPRPAKAGTGIWAQCDVDPSCNDAAEDVWAQVDRDPSWFNPVISRLARVACTQVETPAIRAYKRRMDVEMGMGVDESYIGDMAPVWSGVDLDETSVGDIALPKGRTVHHAPMTVSMFDADGTAVDVDPSAASTPQELKKVKKEQVWFEAPIAFDETHMDEAVAPVQRGDKMVPMRFLWLLRAENRVFLETVAGGTLVIIARSGMDVAAAFAREDADLTRIRSELPKNMELYEVEPDMYRFLRSMAEDQLDTFAASMSAEEVLAGAGI